MLTQVVSCATPTSSLLPYLSLLRQPQLNTTDWAASTEVFSLSTPSAQGWKPKIKVPAGWRSGGGGPFPACKQSPLTEVRTEKASSPVSLLEDLHPIKGWGRMPILTSSRPQHLPKGPSPNSITLWLELPQGNWGRDIAQPTARQLQPPPTEDTKAPKC